MKFRVSGYEIDLRKADVEMALKGVTPERIQQHAVEVGGVMYPMKQAFAATTGFDRLDFTTQQARSVLAKLRFRTVRVTP